MIAQSLRPQPEVAMPLPQDPIAAPASASTVVRFDGVYKTYDERSWVVDNLDLDIRQGEFLSLLGPSGSGKTTTLMMLAGFDAPDRGRILMDGQDISALPAYKRDMGVVFQSYALFPHMSVAQNVAFPLNLRKVPAAEARTRVSEALALARLEGFEDRRPGQLSGGQQQRVALARALVYRPRILLMDEPLGALDKALREHMQLELKAIHQQLGITFVYVTHDQDEAMTMSDRVAVFNDGKIAQINAPHLLYTRPSSRFVANFLGETNLLDSTVIARTASHAQVRLDEDGSTHEACCADASLAPGDRAALAIRPENLRLAAPGEPSINVQVIDSIFHGAHSRIRLRMARGAQLSMTCNPASLGRAAPQPGETLALAVPAEQAMVLR
ncbi:ABC transporter ATP-binding protein [Pseudomonas sp. MYb115]|jgi:putative spermidine/putrescine transport system ATP-binding protein|nr:MULTISPECIES: ABC transporter ATP-binding protein [Pseudomonas]PRA53688.1 ABC transporter ATP-binding protein [Pseudomonas sp. MYb115]QXN48097.1 ABC transporter ATP-binding protein [Pseudomonas fluorescens]WSO22407.1 ABC transporter ATP-binding protein [Pseudomonas fluorescens]